MAAYAAKRILMAIPTFLGITLITFIVITVAPGDPASSGVSSAGDSSVTLEDYQRLRARYRLDTPIPLRYLRWLGDLARFDLGRSMRDSRPVTTKIAERLVPTLALTVSAMILSLVVSIPVGIHAAKHAGRWFDRIVGFCCHGFYAVPHYVMAMVLILVVGVRLGWLPFAGTVSDDYESLSIAGKAVDLVRHAALIGVCFAYPLIAYQVRFVRANVVTIFDENYVRTARAKGLSERRIAYHHVLRNALLPLLTLAGLMLPAVLGGSVILEVMFSWPGMGRLMFEAITQRDYPVVMGLTVVSASLVLLGTLIVDLLYAVVDPRVKCA